MKFFAAAALIASVSAADACATSKASSAALTGSDPYKFTITWSDLAAGTCDITNATYGAFALKEGSSADCKDKTKASYTFTSVKKDGKTCNVTAVSEATALSAEKAFTSDNDTNCTIVMSIKTTDSCKTFAIKSVKDKAAATGASSFGSKAVVGGSAFALASVYF